LQLWITAVPAQPAKVQASGKDTSSIEVRLDDNLVKLKRNIEIDVASAGLKSKGVV